MKWEIKCIWKHQLRTHLFINCRSRRVYSNSMWKNSSLIVFNSRNVFEYKTYFHILWKKKHKNCEWHSILYIEYMIYEYILKLLNTQIQLFERRPLHKLINKTMYGILVFQHLGNASAHSIDIMIFLRLNC